MDELLQKEKDEALRLKR